MQRCPVKQISEASSTQNPRISTSIFIIFVSSQKNAWNLSSIVILIYFVFIAKVILLNSNCFGHFFASRSEKTIFIIPFIEANNNSCINLSGRGFLNKGLIPVLINGLFNGCSSFSIFLRGGIVSERCSELSSEY